MENIQNIPLDEEQKILMQNFKNNLKERRDELPKYKSIINDTREYIELIRVIDNVPMHNVIHNLEIINPDLAYLFIPMVEDMCKYTIEYLHIIKNNGVEVKEEFENAVEYISSTINDMKKVRGEGGEVVAPFSKVVNVLQTINPNLTPLIVEHLNNCILDTLENWLDNTIKNYSILKI